MQEPWTRAFEYFFQYKGRIFGTLFGLIIGIFVITLGWIKAMYFFVCVVGGYLLGKRIDGKENLFKVVKKMFPSNGDR